MSKSQFSSYLGQKFFSKFGNDVQDEIWDVVSHYPTPSLPPACPGQATEYRSEFSYYFVETLLTSPHIDLHESTFPIHWLDDRIYITDSQKTCLSSLDFRRCDFFKICIRLWRVVWILCRPCLTADSLQSRLADHLGGKINGKLQYFCQILFN